jgi:predicted ATPase
MDAAIDVTDLIDRCPQPQVVVTSRQVLRVRLFVERAQAVRPTFHLTSTNGAAVAELCRRHDGVPLAIELAAARTRLVSPDALLSRLMSRLALLTSGATDLSAPTAQLRKRWR